MPQFFPAPALSGKEVLAYGDSLTAGFIMAGQHFSLDDEALRMNLEYVDVSVFGLYGLTAMQLSEDVDGRLVVDVACTRDQGFGSVLEERGPFDLMLIMAITYDLAMGVAPGMVLHSIQTLHAECQMGDVRTVALRVPPVLLRFRGIRQSGRRGHGQNNLCGVTSQCFGRRCFSRFNV